jgi:hypothetical protein
MKPALYWPVFFRGNTRIQAIQPKIRVFLKTPLKNRKNRPVTGIRKKEKGG